MSSKQMQFIIIRESVLQSWARDVGTFALFAGLIGLGVYVGSDAMQWVGAIIGFIAILSRAADHTKRRQMTRAQALKYLQEMGEA